MLFDNPNLLSNEEMREELTKLGYSADIIDSIIEQFWFHDWGDSFISDINHFEVLKEFLKEKNPGTFSRFDFYYYFFEKTLPDYRKLRISFQQLGLYFEQVQKNQIPLTEFVDLLEKIKAPAPLNTKYLEDQKLITISNQDGTEVASWAHHTLTEFLAADHFLSQKNPIDEIKKLVIDSRTGSDLLKSSWIGALRFLIEQNSEYFGTWIVEFLTNNPDSLVDHIVEVVVFATSSSIKAASKKSLFDLIFDRYQEKKFWIPVWAYHNLYKFVDEASYKSLKANADDKEYVHKGNIAAVIDGMFQHNHPLLSEEEKGFWRDKLISYAKEENENEVLNRHALAALENFKGEADIIPQVEKNYKSRDSLVRDAFISTCRAIDANSPDSIDFFIKAIADDVSQIYGRNALYSIDAKEGITAFLQKIIDNPKFIHEFLDNESIFNSKDKKADSVLIDNIRKNKNPEIIDLLKKLVINSYTGDRNYDAGKSYFLQQIGLIIQSDDLGYLDELVKTIASLPKEKQQILFINDIERILSALLKPEELEEMQKVFNNTLHHHAGYALAEAVRLAPSSGNPNGEAVLQKGIELGITTDPKKLPKYEDYQKEKDEKIYKQFQDYLNPKKKGTYFPQVFRHYVENRSLIELRWNKTDKERLLDLAVGSILEKVDPLNFEVHYKNTKNKSGEYTITSITSYFTPVLEVINIINPQILQEPENRKKVVNYIPFSYSSDYKVVREILGEIKDEELSSVNKLMLDKKNDVRYLIPQTYIYFARTNANLVSPKEVLLSLISDPLISESDHEYALDNLERFITSTDTNIEKILEKLWAPEKRTRISDIANGLLITVFKNEKAIAWRFNALKTSATPFRRQEGGHSVGNFEIELDTKTFAKPLINLKDEKYLDRFIDLLDFTLTIVDKPDHNEYLNYLWSIVIAFVARDEYLLSVDALITIKTWAEQHLEQPKVNWLLKRIAELIVQYNLVVKVVEGKNALAFIEGKEIKWTYSLLRAAMEEAGSEQDIDIFISHASAGSDAAVGENSFVKKLNKKLQDKGYKTFLDEEYPTPSIKDKININLPKSKFMIVVGSMRYRKRICGSGAFDIKKELYHFSEREEKTGLPFIFLSTYKISRDDWKIVGVPELQGNRIQEGAAHDADGEVDKVVSALLKWVSENDPETIKESGK